MSVVLVIDDDEISRELLCSELQKGGLRSVPLPSAIGATRAIKRERAVAVVLDVLMPAISGDRLARLLRKNPEFSNLAVILVSGENEAALRALCTAVDADAVVPKGDVRARLAQAVTSAIRARKRRTIGGPT